MSPFAYLPWQSYAPSWRRSGWRCLRAVGISLALLACPAMAQDSPTPGQRAASDCTDVRGEHGEHGEWLDGQCLFVTTLTGEQCWTIIGFWDGQRCYAASIHADPEWALNRHLEAIETQLRAICQHTPGCDQIK